MDQELSKMDLNQIDQGNNLWYNFRDLFHIGYLRVVADFTAENRILRFELVYFGIILTIEFHFIFRTQSSITNRRPRCS